MNYLPAKAYWIIFGISEALALLFAIVIANDGDNPGGWFLSALILFSLAFNIGIFGVCFIIQAIRNSMLRDTMKTKMMKDDYYRMEARRRLDKEGK